MPDDPTAADHERNAVLAWCALHPGSSSADAARARLGPHASAEDVRRLADRVRQWRSRARRAERDSAPQPPPEPRRRPRARAPVVGEGEAPSSDDPATREAWLVRELAALDADVARARGAGRYPDVARLLDAAARLRAELDGVRTSRPPEPTLDTGDEGEGASVSRWTPEQLAAMSTAELEARLEAALRGELPDDPDDDPDDGEALPVEDAPDDQEPPEALPLAAAPVESEADETPVEHVTAPRAWRGPALRRW